MRYQDMDAWSQAMIDGIANYAGDPAVEARCHAATAGIDAAIDDMVPVLEKAPNPEPAQRDARRRHADGQRARQHQARHQRRPERTARRHCGLHLGAADASRPARELVRAGKVALGCRYSRNTRAGSRPSACRRAASPRPGRSTASTLEPEDRVFFMFGSANRDEAHFADAESFDVTPRHLQEHRLRRRPALLRRRLGLARDGRRRGAAQRVRAPRRTAAR